MRGQHKSALFTIGYEKADIATFIATLRTAGVELLVDVRAVPRSRKHDFSKSRLTAHLDKGGIDYLHEAALGNPKAGRDAARAGDYASYVRIFEDQMATVDAREAITRVAEITNRRTVCLLCLERDPRSCHRAIVAKHIAARSNQQIDDLFVA